MRKVNQVVEGDFKYLRIRNWKEFQRDHKGKLRDGVPSPWIKDYTDKYSDDEHSRMSPTERYTLDECRRQRGRFGKNIPNDIQWLLQAGHVPGRHRGSVAVALRALYGRGFLIPCNEQVSLLEVESIEVRDKNKEVEYESPVRPNNRNPKATPNAGASGSRETPRKLGFDPYALEPFDGWTSEQINLVSAYHWEHSDDSFWRDTCRSEEFFKRNFAKMAQALPPGWEIPVKKRIVWYESPNANSDELPLPSLQWLRCRSQVQMDGPGPRFLLLRKVLRASDGAERSRWHGATDYQRGLLQRGAAGGMRAAIVRSSITR